MNRWRVSVSPAIIRPRARMIPDVLHIGPIPIHLFGIFLALAFLAAGGVIAREFARRGIDPGLASKAEGGAPVGGNLRARARPRLHGSAVVVRGPPSLLLPSAS